MTAEQEIAPPPRFLLRPAGVLTQILCAFSLLLGTISFILVQQNKTGGAALVIVWAVAAMAGVVFGGLMSRGGLLSVIASALIVGAFGTVLVVMDWDTLRSLLRLLPEDDVAMIANVLVGVAIAMLATAVLSLASIPQARAYNRALREAEAAAEMSGFFQAQPSGELPRQVHVPITLPPRGDHSPYAPPMQELTTLPRARTTSPVAVPPPPVTLAPGMQFRAGAGSSVAHTSANAPYAGAQSPALAPAYRDAPPAMPSPHAPPAMHSAYAQPQGPHLGAMPSPAMHSPHAPPAMPSPHAPPAMPSAMHAPHAQPYPGAMPSPHASAMPHAPSAMHSPHAQPSMPAPYPATPPSDGPPLMPAPMPGRVSDRNLPLPAPPPTGDGYAPPSAPLPIDDNIPTSASTAPGWTPSPVRTYTTMMLVRPPQVEQRSRRRVYMMLGGFAIGLGAGVGVLVSSMQDETREQIASSSGTSGGSAKTASTPTSDPTTAPTDPTSDPTTGPANTADAAVVEDAVTIDAPPPPPIHNFLDTQRDLIGTGDLAKLAETFAPSAFAFGIDADDVAEGRDAIQAMLTKNLGEPPPDGFKIASKFVAIGQEGTSAWTAEEIELSGPELAPRRIVITQLVTATSGSWTVLALHWAHTVRDQTAERLAILGTLPEPRAITDKIEGDDLARAAKAAFASRRAFAEARSERDDAFNFGSGPNERVVGGTKIKSLFNRIRAELRLDGGVRVVTAGPIGFAALNAVYTAKGRAATDVSQTFRVLAVFLQEGTAWKIVQTQFSNAGPINE